MRDIWRRLRARWLIAVVACAVWSAPLVAHPILTFTVVSHKEPSPGMKALKGQNSKPSDETFPLTITLGHLYLIIEAQGTRTIYDFDRLRILRVALASASYTDDSLYSDIGFRAVEFKNRIMLGTALQAGKVGVNPMEPALMEQLFSLSNPKGDTNIDQHHVRGTVEFFWGKQKLMSVSDKRHELPAAYQSEYWRALRYYAGGHPKIYAALASTQGVPEKVTFVLSNMVVETREMALTAIRTETDAPYSLDGLAAAPLPDEAPYNTLKHLGADAVGQLAGRLEATATARDGALTRGQVLDAMLGNMAILIMTGDSAGTTAWATQHSDAIKSDESARSLAGNLNPRDPTAAQKAVQTLAELRKQPGSAGYMLDVFQGNELLQLRDDKGGEEHLLAALSVNPYLLGAWKDLGGYYYQSFRADKAWACWDAARRVNPQHSMLLPITDMENRLRTAFPEFF